MNNTEKPKNHVLALKQALARKHAAAHPDAEGKDPQKLQGRAPAVLNNKPQKRATGRGR